MTEDSHVPQLKPLDRMLTEVLAELQPFWDFQRKTQTRMMLLGFKAYFSRDLWSIFKDWRALNAKDRDRDILSGQTPALVQRLLELVTPSGERRSLPYIVASGDYTIHEIGNHLIGRFPGARFEALAKLHAIRRARLAFSPLEYLGVVLAAGSLIVKTIPKSVIEGWLGRGSYDRFEQWVFYGTAGVVAYLLVILVPLWLTTRTSQQKHKFIGDILEYAAIAYDAEP